jgi:hypothetical protein
MGDPGTPAQAADAAAPAGERRLKLKTPVLQRPVREYSEYPLCCTLPRHEYSEYLLCCALPCARLRRAGERWSSCRCMAEMA